MYYSHFGLNQAPFKITPNTEFFFSGGNRGPVLEALIYAVTHGEGIIKVTGEVGSGKTMLCHMLQARLPAHLDSVYIANPSVSPDDILHVIAFELQLNVARGATRLEVMQALHDSLLKRYAAGKRVVVFVEESQSMPLATLEEIRLLSNLETSNDKLLQIVLFGQPELDDNLSRPNIRQLRDRITHSFRLEPLTAGEIREYLMFRMRAAGYRGPDLFSKSVVTYVTRASQGLTRRVNLIADKALLAAFSENTHSVSAKHVDAAVRDSEFSRQAHRHVEPRHLWGAGLIAAGAALGIAVYVVVQYSIQERTPATNPPQAAVSENIAALQQPMTPVAPATAPTVQAVEPPPQAVAPQPVSPADPPSGQPKPATADSNTPPGPAPATAETLSSGKPNEKVDSLEVRLAATREWLAGAEQGTYTIQLLGAADATQLKRYLNVISKSVEMNKIFVYRTLAKQKPSLTVLYGTFNDRAEARQVLETLPAALKTYRPLLRTVQGIRGEIQQHQAAERGDKSS